MGKGIVKWEGGAGAREGGRGRGARASAVGHQPHDVVFTPCGEKQFQIEQVSRRRRSLFIFFIYFLSSLLLLLGHGTHAWR